MILTQNDTFKMYWVLNEVSVQGFKKIWVFFVFCVDTHSWNNCWEYLHLEISTFAICMKLGFKFDQSGLERH